MAAEPSTWYGQALILLEVFITFTYILIYTYTVYPVIYVGQRFAPKCSQLIYVSEFYNEIYAHGRLISRFFLCDIMQYSV